MTAVEFIISLKDKASSTIDKIGSEFAHARLNSDKLSGSMDSLKSKSDVLGSSFKGMLGILGIGVGFYKVGEIMREGVEKAHSLHQAHAQLKAGLISTGGVAQMTMESLEEGSKKLSSASLYGRADIMNMQSILLTFPSVTKSTFDAASLAIANLSQRMGQDLKSSAVEVGKALQDPELGVTALRRIGVNFNKEQTEVIKNLVKNGQLAKAQTIILTELNNEFGGSAKAAFDADPMAKYNKMMGSMKVELGDAVTNIQSALGPALMWLANIFKDAFQIVGWFINGIKEGNPLILGLAAGIGALAISLGVLSMSTKIAAVWSAIMFGLEYIQVFGVTALTAAIWAQNVAWLANPVGWVIALIVALCAVFVWSWNKFEGFRAAIKATWEVIKDFGGIIKDYIIDRIKGIISGLGSIAKAIGLLFKGQFKEAWKEAKQGADDLSGFSATKKAITDTKRLIIATPEIYREKYANEKEISKAKIPGQEEKNKNQKPANKTTTEAVASGGNRNTNITITLKNLVESIVFQGGINENRTEMEKQVSEALLRVLYAAQSAG